jgi:hypothetical protein
VVRSPLIDSDGMVRDAHHSNLKKNLRTEKHHPTGLPQALPKDRFVHHITH